LQFFAEAADAFELLDGAAVEALGLGLDPEEDHDIAGLLIQATEALVRDEVAVLGSGDVDVLDHFEIEQAERATVGGEGFIEASGVHASFRPGTAVEGLLGEGDALDGPEFLGVDGLIGGDQVVAEVRDGIDFFEADDGKVLGEEGMFASNHRLTSTMRADEWRRSVEVSGWKERKYWSKISVTRENGSPQSSSAE
jgi:hypothetical protein